ncbi:MAG: Asp-tRNA(Asn)/Glu-tRNA(Gln) amidotransferase subunit GatB [Candidatus Rokuibacteriota bacterium]|nr:MAG: Asp-tRNA(Asn)/Glu-tRNA(Gln) amidotransferase subunit GatB [Candidatus Rokubacteria bacterium]
MSAVATEYETVIGLEVHAQLATRSKMFCGCPTTFGAPPNSQTCPICQGMPGVLPVVNRRAVELAVRAALAFGLRVNPACRFARKHYYYPDMPKNFQISQYEEPLAEDGSLELEVDGAPRRIGIQRLHLEEDVGKLVHEGDFATALSSLVDYNRAGVPLMETVSRPDLRTPEEAAAYLKAFRAVLLALGVCDGNMEEGALRCDANISLRPRGSTELGTKVEIKNLNSFRNVQRALSKEYAHDYRYFPEPDLVPLQMDAAWVESTRAALPELPRARRQRFVSQYGLPAYDAGILTQSTALADYYEAAVRAHPANPKALANWITSELLREVDAADDTAIARSGISPARLAGLVLLIDDGTISGKIAKDVFARMLASGEDPAAIVKREGLTQVADAGALEALVDAAIAANAKAVADFKSGKTAASRAVVGQVMKASGGKANPAMVDRLVQEKLSRM